MSTLREIHRLALGLPEEQRALLACDILDSLPAPFLPDADDGLAEARRRSAELDENPGLAMTWEEIRAGVICGNG